MSSGFISEAEIAEHKKIRQQEWEKVRKPDQPLEVPDEEYDHRTLFERLDEQRKLKEFEYEETHKLKNMVKGLDDDEVEFLEMVDRSKMEEEKKLLNEEQKEIEQFRNRVASLQNQKPPMPKIVENLPSVINFLKNASSSKTSQQRKLLAGAVKRKASNDSTSKTENIIQNVISTKETLVNNEKVDFPSNLESSNKQTVNEAADPVKKKKCKLDIDDGNDISFKDENGTHKNSSSDNKNILSGIKCVAILPSLYPLTDSSDSSFTGDEDECNNLETFLYPTTCKDRKSGGKT